MLSCGFVEPSRMGMRRWDGEPVLQKTEILRFISAQGWWAACACGLLLAGGCARPIDNDTRVEASYSVDDVLERCIQRYSELRTLQARGLVRDYRKGDRRVAKISWDFDGRTRCRAQIEMDVALICGTRWWSFDAASARYRSHRQFTKTPIQTAALLLSDGVPFLLPAIMTTGDRAFHLSRTRAFSDWRLEGVAWHAERPCYVLTRQGWGSYRGGRLRIWIDQDCDLVRGWALVAPVAGKRDEVIVGCSYYDLVENANLPTDRFLFAPPNPILLPEPQGPA